MPNDPPVTARRAGALVRAFIRDEGLSCGPVAAKVVDFADLLRRCVVDVEIRNVDTPEEGAAIRAAFPRGCGFTLSFRSDKISWFS